MWIQMKVHNAALLTNQRLKLHMHKCLYLSNADNSSIIIIIINIKYHTSKIKLILKVYCIDQEECYKGIWGDTIK